MNNDIRDAFDKIHAEDALKNKTADFLHEKIRQKSRIKKAVMFRLAACASLVMLFIAGGISYNLYFTPVTYVDIDVNPSIELTVNRFDKVIASYPYNEDGAAILQSNPIQHMSYDAALDKLIGTMAASGYLKQDGTVSVTLQTHDKVNENNMLASLQTAIDHTLQSHHTGASSSIFAVSDEVKSHAHDNHVTPAKYLAISELQRVDPTSTFEDCRDHTISEINQLIQQHSGDHHTDEPNKSTIPSPTATPADNDDDDDCETEDHHSESPDSSPAPMQNQHDDGGDHDGGHGGGSH